MAFSTTPYNGRDKTLGGATVSTPIFRPRPPPSSLSLSPSHSSNSSLEDCYDHSPTSNNNNSPSTPLQFQGVPFSWEQIPGIPKKSNNVNRHSSPLNLLHPPPPSAGTPGSGAGAGQLKNRPMNNDPFLAAFVACSKDDDNNKVTRSISDRFRFVNLYGSCKTTCDISQSIVYFPRSRNYDHLLNRRSRR